MGKGDKAAITEAAERHVKAGRLRNAISEYQKLLDGTGQDSQIQNTIGDLYGQLGETDKSILAYQASSADLERQGAYSQALAIAKKIHKIAAEDVLNVIRMGDLYGHLGFGAEAKTEYARAASLLESRRDHVSLISLYEKLVKLDRADMKARLRLARLYLERGAADKAVVEFNEVADVLQIRGELEEAERILREALELQGDDVRTVANLVRLFAKSGRRAEAVRILERNLEVHGQRAEVLNLLGNLHLEAGDQERAGRIFAGILSVEPQNSDARAKLGYLEAKAGRTERAYEVLEPLVSQLANKNKEDKAIGLLGVVLMSGPLHVPSLETLATLCRSTGRKRELEIVDRLLLVEYAARGLDQARLMALKELADLRPDDRAILADYRRSAAGIPSPGQGPAPALSPEGEAAVRDALEKAERYASQGLVRIARRLLETTLHAYPDEPRLMEKLWAFEDSPSASAGAPVDQLLEQIEQLATRVSASESGRAVNPLSRDDEAETDFRPAAPAAPAPEAELEFLAPDAAPPTMPETLPAEEPAGEPAARPARPRVEPPTVEIVEPTEEEMREAADKIKLERFEELIPVGGARRPAAPEPVEAAPPSVPPAPVAPPPDAPAPAETAPAPHPAPAAAPPAARPEAPAPGPAEPKIKAEDIFEGIDLAPQAPPPVAEAPSVETIFFDLEEKIDEEADAIEAAFYKQLKERAGVIEKDLGDIVQEFRRQVEAQIDKRNYDARYSLGIAFLEQGLLDEAVEEFILASHDPDRTADCYALIARCYRQKKNDKEARKWLEDALGLAPEGSAQRYAIMYDLASLYEDMNENLKSLQLYQAVKAWNAKYRQVAKRVKILEKIS